MKIRNRTKTIETLPLPDALFGVFSTTAEVAADSALVIRPLPSFAVTTIVTVFCA